MVVCFAASKPVICTVGQRIIYVARKCRFFFYAVIGEKGVDLWKRGVEFFLRIVTGIFFKDIFL